MRLDMIDDDFYSHALGHEALMLVRLAGPGPPAPGPPAPGPPAP